MQAYDVLIVGGGPAGSSCARSLVQAGADVLLLDRKTFPRDKTCAGWVTPQVFEILDVDPAEYGLSRTCQPITGFRTGLIGGREIATDYGRAVSYGIRRCEFDEFLLERSQVRCELGEAFHEMRRDGDSWVVNDRFRARVIVGAGGHFCPVARALGARSREEHSTIAAQEIEFPIESAEAGSVRGEIPELFFCEDLAGYGWCFRKGDYLNIGLGRLTPEGLTSHVKSFCGFLAERGKVSCAIPERFHGHAYQLYDRVVPKLVHDGVLLVGDSAGLAYPQSGEGIRPAVESGFLAAETILASGDAATAADLDPYRARITERFGVPRRTSMSDWVPAAFLRSAAAALLSTHWFSRRVVLDRWFLHSGVPALALAPVPSARAVL